MRRVLVTSVQLRSKNGWHKGPIEMRTRNGTILFSVVFSWELAAVQDRAEVLRARGYQVHIGGPAAKLAGLQTRTDLPGMLSRHNPNACFTSTGCIYNCAFCIVPRVEGDLVEKRDGDWVPKPIVCDNNFTACSRRHFDKAIDLLKPLSGVDFNQGLSYELSSYQASRLAELDMKCIRLAWDSIDEESKFLAGWDRLRRAGFPRAKIYVYVLIGFHDTPDDALYRLEMVRRLGGYPFPMRYQPLNTKTRSSFVDKNWTHKELRRYCSYWSNLRITTRIPFEEFSLEASR